MTQHPLKDITFVHCTEKPHVFPSETSFFKVFQIQLHCENIDVHVKWLLPFNACHIVEQSLFKVVIVQFFEN